MATEHDNYLQLSLTGIKIKSFDVIDYSISDGQPYGGVTVSGDDKLNIKAGRHGSEKVAKWFKQIADTGVVAACDTFDSYPDKLNFAIYGTLTFKSAKKIWVVKNVLFAQGHSARSRNNWWVGGPKMKGGSVKPFIGAIVSSASIDGLPLAEVGFIAPPGCVSHFDLITVAL
ncbi:hypothetical protein BN3087_450038 [Sulfurovum sp. enrichment culture clone C5]|uniref:Uncharacterized protein n=1 Tax=Sulfurovum sp. enrichment culture clone C5 TaxID=497650 RepID=A0A0S4XNC6_9BACT|nr:hypothetical protein BN3087_450038 [Sulfurovum sp. enrichment culture clone C5]